MTNFVVDLIIVGAILGLAGVCALFCVLNEHKEEIWEALMEVIQFKEEKDSGRRTKKQTKIPNQKEKKR